MTSSYKTGIGRLIFFVLAAVAVLIFAVGLSVSVGQIAIPLDTTFKAISNRLFGSEYALHRLHEGVIWEYRMSRALVAAFCGGALALCGVILQALLRNPLAEPYVLGISAGASTGAVVVMVLGFGSASLTLSSGAFFGGLLAFFLVIMLGMSGRARGNDRIILAGVAGSQLFNALTAYIVSTSADAEQARGVMFWLLGNLGGVRWEDVYLAATVAIMGLIFCLFYARTLDAFTFGEDSAASLGVPVLKTRIILFAVTALMTACMVSIVGSVGFIGLVIPHAARFLIGYQHMRLLPAAFLCGAVFMVFADIVSRIIIEQQILPIGVVTALVGAPAFAVILYRAKQRL